MTAKTVYSDVVPAIALDIHACLIRELELPAPFRAGDPNLGEAYGMFRVRNVSAESGQPQLTIDAIFQASSAFDDYWKAQQWSLSLALKLRSLIPKVKRHINHRGCFSDLLQTAPITIGNPRSPINQPAGQLSHLWIVDVSCSCRIELMVNVDPIFGMR